MIGLNYCISFDYIFSAFLCGARWPSIHAKLSNIWSSLLNLDSLACILTNRNHVSHLTSKNIFVCAVSVCQPRAEFVIVNPHMHMHVSLPLLLSGWPCSHNKSDFNWWSVGPHQRHCPPQPLALPAVQ